MQIETRFQVGGVFYTLKIDEPEPKDALHEAIALSNPRSYCNVCQAEGFDTKVMTTNKTADGHTYIKVECQEIQPNGQPCGARSTLGYYKSGGFFWKEYERWTPNASDPEEEAPPPPRQQTQRSAAPAPQPAQRSNGGDEPVGQAALDALEQQLTLLHWPHDTFASWMQEQFGVGELKQLTMLQARRAYQLLDAEVKKAVPF